MLRRSRGAARAHLPGPLRALLLGALAVSPAAGASPAQDVESAQVPRAEPDANAPALAEYLPPGQTYSSAVPAPAAVLGVPVGTRHARPSEVVRYFELLANESPRVRTWTYARSHEGRPLVLAAITSPENHARLEELRRAHVKAVRSGAEADPGPLFVWMGYGVHGNEASAMNTSPLLGYHLAAAEGADIDAFLERTVVLVDPVLNPDGAGRFAHWAN
ncbi:MAG: M14 family zinc carboxypeptidase, partial [Planctomycetota bacterium]